MSTLLIELKKVGMTFKGPARPDLLVLEQVDFQLKEHEICAVLGKSGAGKSTLLRIISGLLKPTRGDVFYRDKKVTGPVKGIAMVFQNFAIMPWLTVLQNVEFGLEALNVPPKERRQRALKAIDKIGLDGFESAYPKELSGGMRQRVGLARALVVEPEVLLMDEPFSSLDVLTQENLRGDLMDLWDSDEIQTKSILLVTHSIEEAALVADRIILFDTDPGQVRAELSVSLPRPRNENDPRFRKLVDDIYTLMTTTERDHTVEAVVFGVDYDKLTITHRLPETEVSEICGLLETLYDPVRGSRRDLPVLADELHLEADALFPLIEAAEILHFAKVAKGDIELTDKGQQFANADILSRKVIFAEQLMAHVPLAQKIRTTLTDIQGQRITDDHFLDELQLELSEEEATRVMKVIIDWGRYAELFAYDFDAGLLSLENPK